MGSCLVLPATLFSREEGAVSHVCSTGELSHRRRAVLPTAGDIKLFSLGGLRKAGELPPLPCTAWHCEVALVGKWMKLEPRSSHMTSMGKAVNVVGTLKRGQSG